MQARLFFSRTSFRFRRWSRSRYAAFVSLHRAVTMGQLASHLADRFYKKQLSFHAGVGEETSAVEQYVEAREDERDACMQELAVCQLLPLCGVAPVGEIAPVASDFELKIEYMKDGECLYGALPVFFLTTIRYEC